MTSKGWANGSARRWRQIRIMVLMRDNWTCQLRGPRCKGRASCVDHLVPLSEGGQMYPPLSMLRASCGPCNSDRRFEHTKPKTPQPETPEPHPAPFRSPSGQPWSRKWYG
jgi:5-methylcytosine-specific restriction endonuclease McrA